VFNDNSSSPLEVPFSSGTTPSLAGKRAGIYEIASHVSINRTQVHQSEGMHFLIVVIFSCFKSLII
jgi:hypothetical protein